MLISLSKQHKLAATRRAPPFSLVISHFLLPQVSRYRKLFIYTPFQNNISNLEESISSFCKEDTRGISGYRARRRVADSRGPVLVVGLSLNI